MNFWIVAGLAFAFGYYCVYSMWTENVWLHSWGTIITRAKSKDISLKEMLTLLLFFLAIYLLTYMFYLRELNLRVLLELYNRYYSLCFYKTIPIQLYHLLVVLLK